MEEKIIWKGLKKKKSVFSERMTVKNSTLLLVYKQIWYFLSSEKLKNKTKLLKSLVLEASCMDIQLDMRVLLKIAIIT